MLESVEVIRPGWQQLGSCLNAQDERNGSFRSKLLERQDCCGGNTECTPWVILAEMLRVNALPY
ncbi:hypothetical protein PF003_g35355 [Phytophthora fragariae]|nr:hypothetical protein PF003_g35355 [Phytophthora fragariae]